MKYKIMVDDDKCIGCGACTVQDNGNWDLVEVDGEMKARAKKEVIDETEYESNKASQDVCPVDAIEIVELKKGE